MQRKNLKLRMYDSIVNGSFQSPSYNTPVETKASFCPIIGVTGLLKLTGVVRKLRAAQRKEEHPCPNPQYPPAARARSEPAMAEAASIKSPAPGVASQPAVRTSTPNTSKATER